MKKYKYTDDYMPDRIFTVVMSDAKGSVIEWMDGITRRVYVSAESLYTNYTEIVPEKWGVFYRTVGGEVGLYSKLVYDSEAEARAVMNRGVQLASPYDIYIAKLVK
jgi:hypothetical protein